MKKPKVAFVCVHNSCRSQIAEALGKYLSSNVFDSYSAGTETKPQINQDAVRLMKEMYQIDMEKTQYSKLLSEIPQVDIVITMGCNVNCPTIPCKYREDWGLNDPTGKNDDEFLKTIHSIHAKILELTEKINKLPMKYFDKKTNGEVLSIISNDVDTLSTGLNQSITQIITSVFTIIGILVMMFSISWEMTIVSLLILPISGVILKKVIGKSQKYFVKQQEYLGHVNGQVEEVYGGHNIVKVFGREEQAIKDFENENDELYKSGWRSQFLSGLMYPLMNFVGNVGYVAVAILGWNCCSRWIFSNKWHNYSWKYSKFYTI